MNPLRHQARRMRWWFAAAMAAIVLCTVMVAIVVIASSNARNSTEVADETVRRMGERTTELMISHLDDAIEATDELTILLTTEQLERRDDELDRLLAAQVLTVEQISGAFVGFPDGAFRFVRRNDDGTLNLRRIDTAPAWLATDAPIGDDLTVGAPADADTDYDPRTRPWYDQALDGDDSRWTDPYVFFSSQQPGVTLSQAIRSDRGELLGVVGIDLSLDELSQFLDSLPIAGEAEAFITAGDVIVAAPTGYDFVTRSDDSIELGTIGQLDIDDDEFRQLALGMSPIETDDGGRLHQIELVAEDAPRWAVLVRTERPELSESVDRAARTSIVAIALTGLLLLLLVPLATRSLRRTLESLDRRARVDTLTDVLNRGATLEATESALEAATRSGRELTIAVVDLDDFKQINDQHGHPQGDAALSELAEVLERGVRQRDIVGRIGGDEFLIAFRNLRRADVDLALSRIQDEIAARAAAAPGDPTSTLTIGVAARGDRTIEVTDLIAEADIALITAKQVRKGSIAWADSAPAEPISPG